MKIVVQRSGHSSVTVAEEIVSKIQSGLVLLVCMEKGDERKTLEKAAEKILNLRVFECPEKERMDKSLLDTQKEVLCISQFTLSWNGKKGNRPSFDNSMPPDQAEKFFNEFVDILARKVPVYKGVFGADMQVQIENQGPVTFHLEFS